MIQERKALRLGAWFTLAYVALGVVVFMFLWLPVTLQGHPDHKYWAGLPWYMSVPLVLSKNLIWLPGGVLLNVLAMIAFFREAGGRQSRRLLWYYGCGIVSLSLFEIGLVVCLILVGPIQVATSGVTSTTWTFYWGDLLGPCVVALVLCLPLFARLGISLLWARSLPEGPGCCDRCGYNLTGNISGVCSECGEQI